MLYSTVVWTADVSWKCPKAVLEMEQSPGECLASLKPCCFSFWHNAPSTPVVCWCACELLGLWSGLFLACCSASGASWRSTDNRSGWEWSSSALWSCQAGQALLGLPGEAEATRAAGSHRLGLSEGIIDEEPWSFSTRQFVEQRNAPMTAFAILLQKDNLWQQSSSTRHAMP